MPETANSGPIIRDTSFHAFYHFHRDSAMHTPNVELSSNKLSEDTDGLHGETIRFSSNLHDRIKPDYIPLTRRLFGRIFIILSLILVWFILSLVLSLYNTWMFAPGQFDFPFPLFVTAMHMVTQFCLSGIVLFWIPKLRPREGEFLSLKEYMYVYLSVIVY